MPIYKTKNEGFFKKWSPEMAYVLGFFTADGNMTKHKNGGCYLEFTSADFEIIDKIKNTMAIKNKVSSRKNNSKTYFRIQIGSKNLFSDLIKLGLTPNKSKTVEFPNIPKEYLNHFLRGYFDGDGHVSEYGRKDRSSRTILVGFTSGSQIFIKQLSKVLKDEGVVLRGTTYYSGRGYRLCFSVNDSRSLYKYMYGSENNLFLSRKKSTFEHYFSNWTGRSIG